MLFESQGNAGFYSAPDRGSIVHKQQNLRGKIQRINREVADPCFAGARFHLIDGVWASIFWYFDVFGQTENFGILTGLDTARRWRDRGYQLPSVKNAVPAGVSGTAEKISEKGQPPWWHWQETAPKNTFSEASGELFKKEWCKQKQHLAEHTFVCMSESVDVLPDASKQVEFCVQPPLLHS